MTPTLSLLRQEEHDLWHRLHVLLYDLKNIAHDPSSAKRIFSTTNELYISEPYFTDPEASRIRTAIVDSHIPYNITDEPVMDDAAGDVAAGAEEGKNEEVGSTTRTTTTPAPTTTTTTVEQALHARLRNFFDKRKASGDARPCGPHDMLPIYLRVFGVGREELSGDRFLSRVRRERVVCYGGRSREEGEGEGKGVGEGSVKRGRCKGKK